jgi:hypothetical protein
VNLRDFGQPWIPTGERSGLQTYIAAKGVHVVRADEKLTAFLALETAIHEFAVDAMS